MRVISKLKPVCLYLNCSFISDSYDDSLKTPPAVLLELAQTRVDQVWIRCEGEQLSMKVSTSYID